MPGHDPLRLKAEEMKMSFDLGAQAPQAPSFLSDTEGNELSPPMKNASTMQWHFIQVFGRMFSIGHEHLHHYDIRSGDAIRPDGLFRLDFVCEHSKKQDPAERISVYDTLDRFFKNLLKKSLCADYLYVERDYAAGGKTHLYYKPLALIAALEKLAADSYTDPKQIFKGHLTMARHLSERLNLSEPSIKLN
jgi:hypothetical protein